MLWLILFIFALFSRLKSSQNGTDVKPAQETEKAPKPNAEELPKPQKVAEPPKPPPAKTVIEPPKPPPAKPVVEPPKPVPAKPVAEPPKPPPMQPQRPSTQPQKMTPPQTPTKPQPTPISLVSPTPPTDAGAPPLPNYTTKETLDYESEESDTEDEDDDQDDEDEDSIVDSPPSRDQNSRNGTSKSFRTPSPTKGFLNHEIRSARD